MTKLIEHSSEMAARKSSRLQVQKTRIGWGKNHWQSRASTARARCLEHASRNFAWTTRRFRRPRGEVPARQRHRAEACMTWGLKEARTESQGAIHDPESFDDRSRTGPSTLMKQ